ncbi:hypothetical protein ANN_02292 [Periplaneta americana]|uniref:Reverse transcriptase domain-containing protein n=1 Tax=Periplaneta americana TaxID=6978 RepID=A0ABQ8TYZ9_PERAM|nr:hypothetical protein ANN_02292 [Periplaneta americana]
MIGTKLKYKLLSHLYPNPRFQKSIENLKKYKSPGIDQIPAELIQEGGSALYSEIYKLVLAIWEKEIVPEQWKESITVPIFKKGDKTNCGNFRGISLLLTSYKILSNILLRRLTPYVDEIIGDHQCGFRRNRSTIDQIFCIRQIMEKKWVYKGTVHQLFIDFKKAYDSVKREVLYDILIEFGIPKKLVRLIKMCLSETYSRVRIDPSRPDIGDIRAPFYEHGDNNDPLLPHSSNYDYGFLYEIRVLMVKDIMDRLLMLLLVVIELEKNSPFSCNFIPFSPKYFPKNLILKSPQSLFLSQSESPSFTAIQKNR